MTASPLPDGVYMARPGSSTWLLVIDPEDADPHASLERWRAIVLDHTPWVHYLLVVTIVAALTIGVPVGIGRFVLSAQEPGTYILLALLGAVVGGVIALFTSLALPDPVLSGEAPPDSVLELHETVQEWMTPETAHAEIWEVNLEIAKLRQIEGIGFDESTSPGRWAIDEVGKFVKERAAAQEARVRAVAERVGFPMPTDGFDSSGED